MKTKPEQLPRAVIVKAVNDNNRTIEIDEACTVFIDSRNIDSYLVAPRTGGQFHEKAYYLNPAYHWTLGVDNLGVTCLIPLKKN